MANNAVRWRLDFALGNAVPPGFEHHGHVDTCDEAKAAVERNWAFWLAASRRLAGKRDSQEQLENARSTGMSDFRRSHSSD